LRARERAASEQKRRSIFLRYIPEVSAAISEIVGQDKDDVEKAFFKALPNFVKLADDGATEEPPPTGGAMPPPAGAKDSVAPPALPQAPLRKKRGKNEEMSGAKPRGKAKGDGEAGAKAAPKTKDKRGRGEQLALI
jgi:hypothetical protein